MDDDSTTMAPGAGMPPRLAARDPAGTGGRLGASLQSSAKQPGEEVVGWSCGRGGLVGPDHDRDHVVAADPVDRLLPRGRRSRTSCSAPGGRPVRRRLFRRDAADHRDAWTTAIALVVAVPLGLGAAVFLIEYARPRAAQGPEADAGGPGRDPDRCLRILRAAVRPDHLLQGLLDLPTGSFSVLAAGLVMGVMIIPTDRVAQRGRLFGGPAGMRQGSAALGANRMQTSFRVVFPAALSGIVAAVVLGVSRAIGETMIVALAAGSQARIVTGPLEQGQTMTGFIASAALGDSRVGSLEYDTLFAVGLLLFFITLLINFISIRLVRRFREAY